jgi:ubiquinone/menaquinone biosynthesis C-methylase UbiE/LmbE family N-acetylglucosaminyl deacetylase
MIKKYPFTLEGQIVKNLHCVYCKGDFFVFRRLNTSMLFGCSCSKYPLLEGIFFLNKNKATKRAVSLLLKGKEGRALLPLLNLRLRLLIPFFGLFLTKISIYRKLGFSKVIKILTFFSYPKDWARYLVKRKKMPTYLMSKLIKILVREKSTRIADIGCGVGQLLGELKNKAKGQNIFGLDASALNLYFARKFFAPKQTLLICINVEKGVPFKDSCLEAISATDAFHNLNNKSVFIKEASRVLKESGLLALIHTANRQITPFKKIVGIPYFRLSRLLSKYGFRRLRFFSNESLWVQLNRSGSLSLLNNDTQERLAAAFSYCVFAGKQRLPTIAFLSKNDYSELKKEEIDYRWDPGLLDSLKVEKLLTKYQRYLFLSPHLDDAVLSCGMLLGPLRGRSVQIVSFFTEASPPPFTPQAKSFLASCGFSDAARLFKKRKKEDAEAVEFFGAKFLHFNFVDAAFRKDTTGEHVYKSARQQFSGEIAIKDNLLVSSLAERIRPLISKREKTLVFAPLGIGGHVDHALVRSAIEQIKADILYWEDFPYNASIQSVNKFFSENKYFSLDFCLDRNNFFWKEKGIKIYKSQMKLLFPNGYIPKIPERYFVSR